MDASLYSRTEVQTKCHRIQRMHPSRIKLTLSRLAKNLKVGPRRKICKICDSLTDGVLLSLCLQI